MRTGPGRDLANVLDLDWIAASQLAAPGVNARLQIKDIRHPVDRRVDVWVRVVAITIPSK